tara:strand:+ start:733 stop:912 length:180 start_codon:yes stop_codon:yes gene_type:complete
MITTSDKLEYLKRKLKDYDLSMDERLEIIEFFLMALELKKKKFSIEDFFQELNRLTGCQ